MVLTLTLMLLAEVAPAPSPAHSPPRVVLISGEDEYDSEASLIALAHLLTERLGMTTTLAASHSPDSVHGLDALASADLAILFVRFRAWPEAEWKKLDGFLARGGSLVALRTSTHAFAYPEGSPLAAENQAFGARWIGASWQWHHGRTSSTDVIMTPRRRSRDCHELLRGVEPSFHSRSWLYHIEPLPDDVTVIARGTPIHSEHDQGGGGEKPKDGGEKPKDGGEKPKDGGDDSAHASIAVPDTNPVAWIRTRENGGRTFYTSLGHPDDFELPAFRRLLLNAIHWTLKIEVPAELDTTLPPTRPLTDFEISTAYVSDFLKPIQSQHFPPEEGIAGFNDVQWIKLKSSDGSLDLRRFDPTSKQGTIYVRSTLHLDSPRQLELLLQFDDALELFVDKKSCFVRQELRTLLAGSDQVPLVLPAGDHDLLFKVMNAGDAWALRARMTDLTDYRSGGSPKAK